MLAKNTDEYLSPITDPFRVKIQMNSVAIRFDLQMPLTPECVRSETDVSVLHSRIVLVRRR